MTTKQFNSDTEGKMTLANRDAFLIIGALEATWAPIVPYVKRAFNLNEAELGLLLICTGLGSILALPVAGPLCKRYGARAIGYVCGPLMAVALILVAANISLWLTAPLLVAFGMCTVQIDVAANVNGVTLEERFKKNMMSGFHGGYSLGTLIGAGCMSLLLTTGMSILPAALIVLLFSLAYFLYGCRFLLDKTQLDTAPHPKDGSPHQRFYIPPLIIIIGGICFVLYSAEGAVMSWSAVFVNQERGVDLRYAGYFFTAFAVFMTAFRLLGNKIVNRYGARRVVVYGSVMVAAGFFIVALVPNVATTALGFSLIGVGEANIVPQLVSYAGHVKGMAVQNAISVITAMGYSGILLGPVIIGFCAHAYGLSATFAGIGVIVTITMFFICYLYVQKGRNA